MTDRHALLIGVPACDSDLFPPIRDVVANDIDRMTAALGQSGYQVRHCGVGGGATQEPTGSRIRAAVLRACQEAPPGGVLLLYFSGHGVVIDGQSYLVPCDAYPEPGGQRPDRDGLVPLVPRYLEHCRARLVVFCTDACREDPAGSLDSAPQGGLLPYPAGGDFALINSCRPGQRSRYADTGSFFTQALAEALDRRSPARTLDEVYLEVERQMARKAARIDGIEQVPEIIWARHGAGARGGVVICEGDQVSEAWRRAVVDTPLWERCRPGTDPERIRAAVTGVVEECARRWGEAQEALAERAGVRDPWSTQDYPVRVLAAVDSFVTAPAGLTPEEVGILAAVPFLREAAVAAGLREAAEIAPTDFSRTYRDGPRADLEITHAMHEHVCRRAEGLARRNRPEARDALAMWLVHRWLGDRLRLWESAAATEVCRRLAATLASGPTGTMTESELCSILRALMQGVGADPDDRRLLDRLDRADFDARFRSLAVALWIGGIVAADPRRMPTVVVDHVGIRAELPLSVLLAATARLDWRRGADVLHLHAVCDHPAMHDAFGEVVMRAERARQKVRSLTVADELLGNLPARFGAAGLRPEHHDGTPAYETPLLRFRLSDEKVRELLMGRQLYGEPALAIRELYQNALDACRYRHVRRRYRERVGRPTAPWTGLVTFRQGRDAVDDREYVECLDNGVGMTVEALKNTFANAGERFVYRQGFRREQARWQDLEPPLRLVPNSQFGVGVFSYFMIADEIQIVTRPVGEDDLVAPQAHSVRIASSGSLFQITTAPDELPAGGTRVRLYLTGEERISVLRTLRRLLWLAEFRVEVAEDGAGHETWREEELRYPDATAAPLKFGADLWWVSGEGGLVADGIRTNEETHGFVVNLRDVRRPQFTVDRNTLRNWDKAWVRDQIRASLPELARWPGLTLAWLWEVTQSTPSVAQDIFSYLAATDRELPVEGPWGHGVSVPIRRVGCLPVDLDLISGEGAWRAIDREQAWLRAWRFGVWRGCASSSDADLVAAAVCTDGMPTVEPLDADMLESLYGSNYRDPARYGRPTVDTLLGLAAHEEYRGIERLRRLRRFAIVGLDLSAARAVPPLARTFEPEDQVLVLALAAWAPPGEPPRTAVGGWLARVSIGLQIPLEEVLRRAGQLVPTGWSPPAGDLATLRDHVFTQAELNLFSQDLDGGTPWIGPSVSPAHVLRASSSLGRPVEQVLELFDRFAPLGYTVAGRDRYPDELTMLEREALRYIQTAGQCLTPLHLLVLSTRTGTSTGQVHRDLARLAGTGLLGLPDMAAYPDFTPVDAERAFIAGDLEWYDAMTASFALRSGWQALRAITREIGSRDFVGFDERLSRFRRLLDIVDPGRPVTVPHLVDLAYYLDCGIGAAAEYLRTLLPEVDFGQLPAEALTSVATCHHWEERLALLGPWYRTSAPDVEPSWQLGAGDIVVAASTGRQSVGEFLDHLEPYREVGAPLPELDEATLAAFRDLVPDRYDQALLSGVDEHGQEFYRDTVDGLELIQLAGRFGWTVAYAHERLARFVPLGVTLGYPVDACPDDLVHWQDLLVVTQHLDGQAPALRGRVGPAHVAAAADEVGESTGQVWTRLRRYAALLGFQVDELGVQDEEEVQGDGIPHRASSPGRVPTG